MLGKIEGGGRKGHQRMRWLDGVTDSMDIKFEQSLGVGDGQEGLGLAGRLQSIGLQIAGHD